MHVEFFDSLEAAQAGLQQAMKAADANVRPWQAAVRPGQLFIAESGEEGLLVFGEVLEAYREERLRHYRFCRCFSEACPEGELGDAHVSTMLCVVSREFFEQMRQQGWRVEAWPLPASGAAVPARASAARWFPQEQSPHHMPELTHSAFRPSAAGEQTKRQMVRSGNRAWG